MRTLSTRDSAALAADLGWSTRSRVSLLLTGTPAEPLDADEYTFALWRLNEAVAFDPAIDVVDRFHGTPTGNPPLRTAPGNLANGRAFSTTQYFLCPTMTADQQAALREELTIEALVYLNAGWSTSADVVSAGGSGETPLSNALFEVQVDASRRVRFMQEVQGGVNVLSALPADPTPLTLPVTTWKHIAVRRRWDTADTMVVDFFVDGVKVHTDISYPPVSPMSQVAGGASRVALGCWHELSSFFNGGLSNICISTVARTDADILQRARQLLGVERWVDLTNLEGRDYLVGYEVNEDIDQPVAQATVRVRRELDARSLAPLRNDARPISGVTLLEQGRRLRIEAATVPVGAQAGPSDWRELFRGDIDRVESGDTSGDVAVLTARDLGAELQDRFVETETEYGSTSGTPVQTVMQAILDDVFGAGVVPLQVDTTNGAVPWGAVKTYLQQREPVLDALRGLALQMGWDVRYRWRDSLGAFALTLSCPDRNASTPVFTFGAKQVLDFGALEQSREDVRNVIEVVYSDSADKDSAGVAKRKTVTVQDAASIAKYKRKWMQLALDAADAIDTNAEATTLANAALADLKDPLAEAEAEVPLFWPVQLGDYIGLKANGLHFNADQSLAVVGFTHRWDGSSGSTQMRLRGKPAVASGAWLEMETRPGLGEPAHSNGPGAPTNVAFTPYDGGVVVTWTPPALGEEAASYDLYVDKAPHGWSPSATNFRGNFPGTRAEVTGLERGASYVALITTRNAQGQPGATYAPATTFTPAYVQPAHVNPDVAWFASPLNSDFEAQTTPNTYPDGWQQDETSTFQGVWGTDIDVSTTEKYSGARAMWIKNTAKAVRFSTGKMAARPGDIVTVDWMARSSVAMGTISSSPLSSSPWLCAWVNAYDINGTVVLSQRMGNNEAQTTAWSRMGENTLYGETTGVYPYRAAHLPANTAYIKVFIGKHEAVAGADFYVDSVRVNIEPASEWRSLQFVFVSQFHYWGNFNNSWTVGNDPKVEMKMLGNGMVVMRGVARSTGGPGATIGYIPPGYQPRGYMRYPVYTSQGMSWIRIDNANSGTEQPNRIFLEGLGSIPSGTVVDFGTITWMAGG